MCHDERDRSQGQWQGQTAGCSCTAEAVASQQHKGVPLVGAFGMPDPACSIRSCTASYSPLGVNFNWWQQPQGCLQVRMSTGTTAVVLLLQDCKLGSAAWCCVAAIKAVIHDKPLILGTSRLITSFSCCSTPAQAGVVSPFLLLSTASQLHQKQQLCSTSAGS